MTEPTLETALAVAAQPERASLIESREGITTSVGAMQLAFDWAEGRRSWANLGPHDPYTPDVIAVMDAQEVVKWTAIAASMRAMGE